MSPRIVTCKPPNTLRCALLDIYKLGELAAAACLGEGQAASPAAALFGVDHCFDLLRASPTSELIGKRTRRRSTFWRTLFA